MTGAEAIESFLIHYDLQVSFSAQGFEESEILLFLNNAQDQFIKNKVFGENFQPPAFEDNQKRVVDILPLFRRSTISSGDIGVSAQWGNNSYNADKSAVYSERGLYTVDFDARITRTNPVVTNEYVRCERIKAPFASRFISSAVNKTHFINPKVVENQYDYFIICDSYTTLLDSVRLSVILRPYPITASSQEYDGTYASTHMSLDKSVHQEIVDMAVKEAIQTSGDPRYQTEVTENKLNAR